MPPGLVTLNVGGGFFGHGERYYLTPSQRSLLDQEPEEADSHSDDNNGQHTSIIDSFLNLFR